MEPERYSHFISEIKEFLPSENIYTDSLRTLAWGTDASFYRIVPRVVVRTRDAADVSRVMAACSHNHIPYTFRAAGTSLSGQSLSDSVLIVAGKNWRKYDLGTDGSVVTLQPGLIGAEVNHLLKPYGRVFGPDPASVGAAMIGGIVANNASGMNCGVHANSDRLLVSAEMILADGTILDTGDEKSRAEFRTSHPDFLRRIEELRDRVRADKGLTEKIKYKYSIKNVTGLNIRPLVAYDDPFDIIAHSLVGSEGTLAFISSVRMRTLGDYPFKATAMVYFTTMKESCNAVVALKKLHATGDDMERTGEDLMVKSAEMLDYMSLASVGDPVFEQYKKDVDAGLIGGVSPGDYHNLTALLTETKAATEAGLSTRVKAVSDCLSSFSLYRPVSFTTDATEQSWLWAMRSGIFPSVGGMRPTGTSCLIEDIAFHVEDLPEATVKLQNLIADHGYHDACIYGHAFEGNYHFILNQSFASEKEVERYSEMMHDVARLVTEYGGSLKAEHGTGRNMAPFVGREWGDDALKVMHELKDIFDPEGLINPGVIFNDDPECFIHNLKSLPVLSFDYSRLDSLPPTISAKEMIEGAKRANKCIECGFCESHCVSCGFTLSSRQRIASMRTILALRDSGNDKALLDELTGEYKYLGEQTCVTDGLCSTSCPMKINTGDMTHLIRQIGMMDHKQLYKIGEFGANHMAGIKKCLRGVLKTAALGHTVLGTSAMTRVCEGLNKAGLPLWTPAMPHSRRQPTEKILANQNAATDSEEIPTVVYFPSCINQTMGLPRNTNSKRPLVEETVSLLQKAGFRVVFPKGMERMCCGQIWESKGMIDIADRKSKELEAALYEASAHGKYPVLCDQSPCLHRMKKVMSSVSLYGPVEFILTFLKDRLLWHKTDRRIAIHLTCSTRELGVADDFIRLARMCSSSVLVPEGIGCCAFAGDRGFTYPEENRYALRDLRRQVTDFGATEGYSNSRTCEIGLAANSGITYRSIVYLVNECTEPKHTNNI